MKLGIVGATGLVGSEILKVLESRQFPVTDLALWASERSAGAQIQAFDKTWTVEALSAQCFQAKKMDYIFFAGGGSVSADFVPAALETGAFVIDNSSHFRMHDDVPLIVPEVNASALKETSSRLIANPNCSTIQLMVALSPLQQAYGLKRVVVSTYQSVSGAGAEAMDELEKQVSSIFSGRDLETKVFPHQMAFNCLPHIDVFQENGMTKEEMKIIHESRKILDLPELRITATAVRVPVFISHAESVNIELEKDFELPELREHLAQAKGLEVVDDPGSLAYPHPVGSAGIDHVQVGRIRRDESVENGLQLWVVADNLRKGAATNAVQIAESLLAI